MEVSIETFVQKMIMELSGCHHVPTIMVYGCISALRENHGYICKSTDEEIYNRFVLVWRTLYE